MNHHDCLLRHQSRPALAKPAVSFCAAIFMALIFAVAVTATKGVHAAGLSVDIVPNYVGAGVGATTEWMGSKDYVGGLVPGGRMQFSKHRFVEVMGPVVDVNLLDVPNWELGPMLTYRLGRKDVEDPVVNRLPAIDGGLEAGLFAGYHYLNTRGTPWRLRVGVSATTGVAGDATGGQVTPYASIWVPLSPTVFFGVGGGLTWSSASFMQQRFGVTLAGSTASGLPAYSAGAGVRQGYLWPALLVRLDSNWYTGVGAFYQRLTGDAADSPIVVQRGSRDQWTIGAGLGYSW